MMKTLIAMLSLLCLTLAPASFAADVEVSVSGDCHDSAADGGEGGSASVGADNGGDVDAVDAAEVVSAVNAVGAFASEPAQVPAKEGCSAAGDDYVEAEAKAPVAGTVGVCYNGNVNPTPC